MHTVVAFMTLDALFSEEDGEGKEHVLLKYVEMGRDAQRTCEVWRAARVARLLDDFGTDNVMRWHGLSTREEVCHPNPIPKPKPNPNPNPNPNPSPNPKPKPKPKPKPNPKPKRNPNPKPNQA